MKLKSILHITLQIFTVTAVMVALVHLIPHNTEAAGIIPLPEPSSEGSASLNKKEMPSETLPSGRNTSSSAGSLISFLWFTILPLLRIIAIPIFILAIVILGYMMATSGNEEKARTLRNQLFMAIGGLVVITLAQPIVEILFGENFLSREGGENVIWNDKGASIKLMAGELSGLINFAAYVLTAAAIIVMAAAGFFMMVADGEEEEFKTQKRVIAYAAIGLILIAISRTIVATLYGDWETFTAAETSDLEIIEITPDPGKGIAELVGLLNFALQFAGAVAVLMVIYAGYLWLTAGGEDEAPEKAKKIITSAVIGLVIIISSYVIINTFMPTG